MYNDDEDSGVGPIATPEGRASEDKLGVLHGIVAEYLTLAIQTGSASPAIIGAAITYLKNNSITASASKNAALDKLSQTLQERRNKKGGLTPAAAREAESAFGALMGDMPGWQQ